MVKKSNGGSNSNNSLHHSLLIAIVSIVAVAALVILVMSVTGNLAGEAFKSGKVAASQVSVSGQKWAEQLVISGVPVEKFAVSGKTLVLPVEFQSLGGVPILRQDYLNQYGPEAYSIVLKGCTDSSLVCIILKKGESVTTTAGTVSYPNTGSSILVDGQPLGNNGLVLASGDEKAMLAIIEPSFQTGTQKAGIIEPSFKTN